MSQIVRPPTAFALDGLRQKQPRQHDRGHLVWIRTLPSLVPGHDRVEAAHIRYADDRTGKRSVGMALKPSDKWVVPLAADQHRDQHSGSERDWWIAHGIDPVIIAALLYAHSGDDTAAQIVIRNARAITRRSF